MILVVVIVNNEFRGENGMLMVFGEGIRSVDVHMIITSDTHA